MSVYGPSYMPAVYTPVQPSAEHQRLMAEGLAKIEALKNRPPLGSVQSTIPSVLNNVDINALIRQVSKPTTTTATQTTTNKQLPSPDLEKAYNDMLGQINTLSQNTQQAFNNKSGTYTDLLTSLANMYNTARSGSENAAIGSALSSGLTPLEATSLGQEAGMEALRSYFPQRAALRSEQADVGIGLQQALQGLLQGASMPLLQGLIAPYLTGVAGQRSTTTNQQTGAVDPSSLLSLLSKYAQQEQAQSVIDPLDLMRLQQDQNQFDATMNWRGAQMEQDWQKTLFNKQLQEGLLGSRLENAYNLNQMDEAGALQRLLLGGMLDNKTPDQDEVDDVFDLSSLSGFLELLV